MLPKPKNGRTAAEQLAHLQGMLKDSEFAVINLSSKKRVPLVHKETIVGRNPNLMIQANDISVSSKHACFEMNKDFTKVFLCDLGAQNGCFVNGQKLEPR